MQLDGGAQRANAEAHRIPLGSAPGTPFHDDDEAPLEKLLTEFPLQRLHLRSAFLIVKIDGKGVHPFVGSQPNCSELALEPLRQCGLP